MVFSERVLRILLACVGASCGTAIVVSRLYSENASDARLASPSVGVHDAGRLGAINGQLFATQDIRPYFLDAQSGSFFQVPFSTDDLLVHPSCSPWCDSQGRRQVVAGWKPAGLSRCAPEATGIARFSFPDAKRIDCILCEPFPVGAPAWWPDGSARIIYPGLDGALYHLSFEHKPERGPDRSAARLPRPLRWNCTPPGSGAVRFRDVFWPTSVRLRNRLIVSLYYTRPDGTHDRWQLWWLRLNDTGTAIESAGRLISRPASLSETQNLDENLANLADGPNGRLILSYLTTSDDEPGRQLRLAPVDLDAETGIPRVHVESNRLVAENRSNMRPELSPDGRWVFSPPWALYRDQPADRFSVGAILNQLDLTNKKPGDSASGDHSPMGTTHVLAYNELN